ncbi:MAG: Bifunctional protein: zinc-containing alcohol dehydrogenase quinone oxidoreductase (NADPH:quinone reductase) Similar to arginate lyase [Lentilactobacillus parabuchneri]|nr:Zinc-type alcohol dehydrogenase-like protein [Lentilactobacillus parabuchneri]ORN11531.1 Zinc-type alcohol dehydrogenase-like protein [Lentilactobacillus parabuchneri]ORN15163.1 Zinc-type alcohol dehydrogenase-like protein [Lentilactobacillus parabuchneri]ORN16961.1 Zinc-type alcohol dehydrogenase-like protein [Lentilactobacillus parabuchneri]ORN20026.1 Zinc-type alcohol dehydrogenase-like protein [Lentilactobacillus parabuchneri]
MLYLSPQPPSRVKWTKNNDTDLTVNHHKNLVTEVRALGTHYMDYILNLNDLDGHWNEIAELIRPQGKIAAITENHRKINLQKLSKKSATFDWEWMYTKSYYHTDDMISQHEILDKIAGLLDNGTLHSTVTKTFKPINVTNLKKATELVETNHMIGKVTLSNE